MAGWIFSQIDEDGANFLTQATEYLRKMLPKEISYCFSKLGNVEVQDYDTVYGLAGIGRFLLLFREDPSMRPLLEKILDYLVQLTGDITIDGREVPGWYIEGENLFAREERNRLPQGGFDLGLAHGIAGPLALLSIALLSGAEVRGQRAAVQKIAGWLNQWPDEVNMSWPGLISLEEYFNLSKNQSTARDAWCYGAPGIARVLWLAGCVLEDINLKNRAIQAFDALLARPDSTWNISSPAFCHGFSGLLCLTNLMRWDTGLERFAKYQEHLIGKVIDHFTPKAPFGFYTVAPTDQSNLSMNNAGLLEGSAGIVLTLLAVIRPPQTDWTTLFLIA